MTEQTEPEAGHQTNKAGQGAALAANRAETAIGVGAPLGWGRFLLQFTSVAFAFIAASVPPVLIWGETAFGMLFSVVLSMVGALLVAWAWLRKDGAVQAAWSLQPPRDWGRGIGIALGATFAIILIFQIGAWGLEQLGLPRLDAGPILQYVSQSPLMLVLWIVLVAWFAAGLGEELLWRGFLMDRLARLPGLRGRGAWVIAVQAALFGLPHLYQGISGVILTALIGVLLGWMRLRLTRSLWPLIMAHALVDTVMMSFAYFAPNFGAG